LAAVRALLLSSRSADYLNKLYNHSSQAQAWEWKKRFAPAKRFFSDNFHWNYHRGEKDRCFFQKDQQGDFTSSMEYLAKNSPGCS
jgi:hypothetical protein